MKAPLTSVILAAALPMFALAEMTAWFNPQIETYTTWPTNNAAAFGGEWVNVENATLEAERLSVNDGDFSFLANESKNLDDGKVVVCWQGEGDACLNVPAVPDGAKSGLCVVSNSNATATYHILSIVPESEINEWVDTGIPYVAQEPVSLVIDSTNEPNKVTTTYLFASRGVATATTIVTNEEKTVSQICFNGNLKIRLLYATSEQSDIEWTYSITNGIAVLGTGSYYGQAVTNAVSGVVEIPETIGGCPVGEISAWAFRGCTGITSVTIPPSVSKIGTGAFEGCTNLKTISLPDDLRSVSSLLFSRCESLEELVIPEGVTSVGNNVIQGCSSLKRLILPTTLVSAVDNAFANAPALEEVVGLENVTDGCYFSYSIFSGDSSLKRVDLSRIDVSGGVGMFSSCTSLEEVILPTRGWAIGEWAFAGCTSLTNVAPAYRIAGIGSGAFSGCDALKSFTIYGPASVPPVEATNGSFCVCTYISTNAFLACSNLSQVVFKGYPVDDEDYYEGFVADDAFDGCTAAIGVYSPRYSDIWTDAIDDNGKWHGLPMQVGEAEPMTLIIEDDVVVGYRGDCADQIVIPEGVKGIAQYAFAGCLALKSVSIPDSVTNIGEYAFTNCSNLVSVVFNGDEPYARWASFAGMRSDCVFYVSGDDREWSIDIPGRWYEHPILYWSPVSIQNEEYLIFAEDFEKGATLMSLMTVGTFPTPPGIKDNMGVGESRAFSFGRSSAGSNAWTSYMNTLIARFDREYVITRIEFDEMERYDNWGSQGTLQANGMTIENTGFAKLPSNNHVADTEFRHRSFDVSVVATNLSFHCEDITSSSELFIDNIRIYGRPLSYYVVSTIGSDDNDGKSCDSAFRTIQQAVDVASDGDTIYVLPGLYEPVICTNKAVFVEAIGGAGATVIDAGSTNHCARFDQYVGYEWEVWERTSKLTGFTLINGFACDYSEDWLNAVGGGVVGGILENCIITQCHAENGGGAYGSELNDCLLEENWGNWFGGAAMCHLNRCVIRSNHTDNEGGGVGRESIANNCLIVSNTSSSYSGAGASQSTLNNCTVVNNISDCTHDGAGVYCCNAVNCIVWGNYNNRGLNLSNWFRYEDSYDYGQMSYTCTYPLFEGEGNTSDDPQLAKISADEYRIGRNSPCLDSGSPIWNSSETDLAGAPRVQGTSVDMGCCEGAANGVIVHTAVSEGYGSISESFVAAQGESVVVRASSTDDARPLEGFYINGTKAESSQVRKEGADYLLDVTLGDSDVSIEARFVTYNFHVATSGDDSNDGLSWDTAKRTIQAAVSIARPQDSVIVTNGVYAPFRKNDGYDITISSVNGALETIIDGGGTNRCAYLYDADMHMVKLVGFTLQNGYATYGGGVYGGRVSKCIIRNNVATRTGGGSCYTWLDNCLVMDNVAASTGGGVAGTGYNASSGIAGWPSVMRNCTVVGNQAATGGGIEYTYAINSIVVNNVATNSVSTNGTWNCQYVNVCIDPSRASDTCVGLDPLFVDAANGDYRLSTISPCIDAGDNAYVESATDLGGNARVVGDRVDIGAYEFGGLSRFNVAFDLGEHGTRISGGELVQSVIEGAAAVAPEVSGERGWLFDGWDADFSAVCSNMTVVAQWSPLTEYRGSVTSSTVDFATVIWDGGVSFPDADNTYSNLVLNIETNAVLTVRERLTVDSLTLTGCGNLLIQMVGDGAFYPGAINTSSYGGTLNFKLCDGARLDYYLGRSQGTYTAPTGGDFLPFLTYGLEVEDGGRLGFTYTTNGHCNIESYDFSKITGTGTVSLDTIYNGNSNWILLPDSRFAETLSFNIESDVVVPPSYAAENPFYVRNFSGNGRFRCDWNDSFGNYIMREFYTVQTRNTTFTGRFMSNTNGNGAREVNMHVLSDGDVPDYENKRLILSGEGGLIDNNGGIGFYDAKGALTVLTNGALEINYMWGGAADIYGAVGGCGGFSSNVVFETGAEFILSTNGHLTATGSLAFGDSLTVRTDEEPMGLLVLAVEDSVAVPDISNTDLILYVKGERSDLFRFLVMEDGLYVAPKDGVKSVRFDVGEHGHRAGGGNLLQFITEESEVEAPVMRGDDGWVFIGWDIDIETMQDGDVATAQYRTLKADLHVDTLNTPESATTGDKVTIAWTLGNSGNPNWSGNTFEQIRLVNASDPLDVIVVADLAETLEIARDGGQLSRSYEWAIPVKGPVGVWYVEVETAIGASNEHGGINLLRSESTLTITQCPLPDLSIKSIVLDLDPAEYMPLDTVTVRYVVQNTGTGAATAPWRDRLYLCKNGAKVTLATVDVSDDIAAGAEVERTIQCVIPELVALSGDLAFVVKADCDDSIVELADDDSNENATWEATPNATLGKRIYLTFASLSVNENNSSGVRFYAKRSGEVEESLELSLTAFGATSDVTFPESLTINAGASSVTGYVRPLDNSAVDGTRFVTFMLSTVGDETFTPVSQIFSIIDNEVPKLTMSFDKVSVKEGEAAIVVTVTRELVTGEPLTVYLNGVSTSHCSYPSSVVIPAGEASVTFELAAVDNDAAEIAAALTLRASANGYTAATQSFSVEDDDVPSVTLTIYPEELSEGAGPNAAYAILSRVNEDNIGSAITVNLTPSIPNQLILQSSVTIPAYTMAVRFQFGPVDNGDDEGDRDITITGSIYIPSCGCSSQPSSGDVIEATIRIIDNDVPALSLTADPSTMKEGLDHAGDLILSHNSVLTEDLVVSLSFDTEGEIEIPASVVIPAGETSVTIPVKTIDDGETDGGKLVSVYADDETGVFATASTWIQVSDQNLSDLKVVGISLPESVYAGKKFDVDFETSNIGFVNAPSEIEYNVHLIGGARGSSASSANMVYSGKIANSIVIGESIVTSLTVDSPSDTGDYRIVVVLDPDGKISELDDANNSFTSDAIAVSAAYTATVAVADKVYLRGDEIVFTGNAVMPNGTTPASDLPVDLYVLVNGMRRTYHLVTDANGAFGMTFEPSSGEAGRYTIGACYPGVASTVAQDYFDILGMKRSSTSNIIWDYALGDVATRTVYIQNRSGTPLTGLTATFTGIPEECDLQYTLPDTIPANGSVALAMTATAVGVTEQVDYSKFTAHLEVAEGLTLDFPLYFHSQTQKAYLRANPSSINTTMAIGHTRYIDVTISNDGKGDSGLISLSVPDVKWLRIISGTTIDNLASGESATVTLEVAPEESHNLLLNNPLRGGRFTANCENGTGVSIALTFTPVSDNTGSVFVDTLDNNTYVLESGPHLSNAVVRITNPYTGALVRSGTTGQNGTWAATGIPEGRYQLTITAANHDSYADELVIEPEKTSNVEAFLQYQIVTATWNVERTEIEDSYEVTLLLDFETSVPAPVVNTIMPTDFPTLNEGESWSFTVTLQNTGVIAAERVTVIMPEIEGYTFTLSDNDVAVPAKSSVEISGVFSRPKTSLQTSNRLEATITVVTSIFCTYKERTIVVYPCGKEHPEYSYEKIIRHGECETSTAIYITDDNWNPSTGGGESTPSRVIGPGGGSYGTGSFSVGPGSTYKKKDCDVCLSEKKAALDNCRARFDDIVDYLNAMIDRRMVSNSDCIGSAPLFTGSISLQNEDRKYGDLATDVYGNDEVDISKSGYRPMTDAEVRSVIGDSYWIFNGRIADTAGLKAWLYVDKDAPVGSSPSDIYLVFAGTEHADDWMENVKNGVCSKTDQYETASSLLQSVLSGFPGHIHVVGHSLGGGLTQYAMLTNDLEGRVDGTTFNSAGLCESSVPDLDHCNSAASAIRNFRALNDPVSYIGNHLGPIYTVDGADGHFINYFGSNPPEVGYWTSIGWSLGSGAALWIDLLKDKIDDLKNYFNYGLDSGGIVAAIENCLSQLLSTCDEYDSPYSISDIFDEAALGRLKTKALDGVDSELSALLERLQVLPLAIAGDLAVKGNLFGGTFKKDGAITKVDTWLKVKERVDVSHMYDGGYSKSRASLMAGSAIAEDVADQWLQVDPNGLVAFLEAVIEHGEISLDQMQLIKPEGVSDLAVENFYFRMTNTVAAVRANSYDGIDCIDLEQMYRGYRVLKTVAGYVNELGYDDFKSFVNDTFEKIEKRLDESSDSVCATITLQLSQSVSMTREAFSGTLTINNGNTQVPITALKMDVSITDEEGNECKDMFVTNDLGNSGATSGGYILDGGLTVAAGGTGSSVIQFIPERRAAETEPKLYKFGGTITYIDPFSGESATIKLTPVALTVNPSPYLKLHYFVQRDVYGDDPNTETVEASMPAEMALLVVNEGAGNANNVTIASVQPSVVKNEKGLSAEFSMKDYSLEKTALNGATAHLGLNTVALGTIPAGESQVAQWWLTSSIDGHFTDMAATVTPVNSWNTPDTMLVNPDVGKHLLIRSLSVAGETMPYFLVSEGADLYGTPNVIYSSDGCSEQVHNDATVVVNGQLVASEPELSVAVTVGSDGWNYGNVRLDGVFRYRVVSVVRSDNTVVPVRNVWITNKIFRDGLDPILEERLHIIDEFATAGTQTYTITLEAKPSDVPEVDSFNVENGQIEYVARNSIEVQFSKAINASTFTLDDVVLRKQGVLVDDISSLSITPSDATGTRFTISGLAALCGDLGRYELVVQCAGIYDLSGQLGISGKSVAWTLSTPDSPYILDVEGRPTRRVQCVDGITAVMSVPVTEESAKNLRITLNGEDISSSVKVDLVDPSYTRYWIHDIGKLQLWDGEYTLVVDGGNLVGQDGGSGIEAFTVIWTVDTRPPTLNYIRRDEDMNGTSFLINLSEDVDSDTISLDNIRLVLKSTTSSQHVNTSKVKTLLGIPSSGETEISLPATARLTALGDGSYSVSGLDSVILADGTYTLYFDATGVADEAGNEASGVKSVSWTVDTTPPDEVTDIAISSEYGSVDTCVYTATRELTISGTVPESGLTVEVFAKYVGSAETLLVEPEVDGNLRFTADVTLPGDGNLTIIIRLTDEYGNSSDTEFAVYVDAIALGAEISGMPEPDVAADTLTITFLNGTPAEASALAATMSLTKDGVAVAIPNVTIARTEDRIYTVSGLANYTAEYGTYVFSYDVREVAKATSGITGAAVATAEWVNYPLDTTAPTIADIKFNGAVPAAAYVTDQMFTEVAVRFSEAVNVPALVEQGIAGQAFSIQFLSDDNEIVGTLPAEDVAWNATTFTASWTIDGSAIPCGKARLVVDASLIKDASGNGLATTDAYDIISGAKTYTPSVLKRGVAYSYACPELYDWNNDGLLDLIVGEKTENGKGKVRIYLNRGTASQPEFDDYTYLQKSGEDVEFTGAGCVGMQVSFGHLRRATMVLATSQGEIYGWRHRSRDPKTKDSVEWESWFDHSTDSRFAGLQRTQTFCCDIDGDGYDEVIVSGQNSPMFWLKRTLNNGEYETECTPLMDADGANLQFPAGQNHTAAIMTDVSGDAVLDLVTGDTAGNVWVYYGTGNARFSATPVMIYENTETSNKRSRLALGDINGDGVEDILVGRQDGSVLLFKGEAVLSPAVNFKCVEIKSVEEALNDYIYWVDGADGWTCEQFGEEAQATVTHTGDAQTTVLSAKFTGMGTVTFTWAVSGSNESSEFRCTGGNPELIKAGPFSQIAQTVTLSTPGEHLISWVFRGRNTAIVRDVAFTPSDETLQVTQTTVVPIPFADINRFANDVWKAHGGDYEAAANATAANGRSVMENCIAGVDSSNPDAEFTAKIKVVDGVAKISWMPALNGEIDHEGVPTGIRTYTVYGTENLETPNWQLVTPENKPSMRFFKVKVQMP